MLGKLVHATGNIVSYGVTQDVVLGFLGRYVATLFRGDKYKLAL